MSISYQLGISGDLEGIKREAANAKSRGIDVNSALHAGKDPVRFLINPPYTLDPKQTHKQAKKTTKKEKGESIVIVSLR